MAEITTIFTHGDKDNELGIDMETGDLYWKKKKILTEHKLTLAWWVNGAIACGAGATVLLAALDLIRYFSTP